MQLKLCQLGEERYCVFIGFHRSVSSSTLVSLLTGTQTQNILRKNWLQQLQFKSVSHQKNVLNFMNSGSIPIANLLKVITSDRCVGQINTIARSFSFCSYFSLRHRTRVKLGDGDVPQYYLHLLR